MNWTAVARDFVASNLKRFSLGDLGAVGSDPQTSTIFLTLCPLPSLSSVVPHKAGRRTDALCVIFSIPQHFNTATLSYLLPITYNLFPLTFILFPCSLNLVTGNYSFSIFQYFWFPYLIIHLSFCTFHFALCILHFSFYVLPPTCNL